jgi:hypothetical protein
MDKTVFTGVNAETCILIKPDSKWIHGEPDEIADMLQYALTDAVLENPQLRRPVTKALRRVWFDTLPEVLRYWLEGWPFTLVGMAVLFGIVYGFAALMRALGA